MGKMVRIVLVIACIAGLSGTSLTALKNSLSVQIENQRDVFVRGPALEQILENVENDPVSSRYAMTIEDKEFVFYPGFRNGECVAVAFETVGPGGYGGDVKVMVGFNLENSTILGVAATEHSETPGIGSRALEVSYLSQYFGKPISENFALQNQGGNIEVLTGATFTSTAVSKAVQNAAQIVREHQQEIKETLEKNYETN